jgi:hypothetical protein
VFSEDGNVGLVRADSAKYQEISRFKLPNLSGSPTWVYPVICNGKLYLRDQQNIFCYDIKAN